MRMFLPIKGPGGRYLTPREKVALLILGLTLVLCLLTLLAGEGAFSHDGARNPVFGFVSWLCRTLGGGVIALYGLVLVWSGLIYFKGEQVAVIGPLPPRLFAAICVTVGVSGALGIAHLETAGGLGLTVGLALGNTLGAGVGFPILILLMLLGAHLAGQGAWLAIREPAVAGAPGGAAAPTGALGGGFGLQEAAEDRFQAPPLPDDGDPSPAERTAAVTRAMEEIERSRGVRIVDVEREEAEGPGEEEDVEPRPSIGEEVEAAPPPPTEAEEAEVQRGLESVRDALVDEEDAAQEEEEACEESRHGFVPVPAEDEAERYVAVDDDEEDEADEAADSFEDEEEEDAEEEEDVDEDPGDPYARGGLLRRLRGADDEATPESDRPYTSFDWRGRPLDG